MEPFTMMMIASAVSAGGEILGGIGASKDAKLNAFNTETEKKLSKVQAMQQAQARRDEYEFATSANKALLMGLLQRDDPSVAAFLKREKETIGKDLGRVETQIDISGRQADIAAENIRQRGRTTLLASTISAASGFGQAYAQGKSIQTQNKLLAKQRI